MNVLIVDDQPINLKLLHATLEAEGHTVAEAVDGVEALSILEEHGADAVISDILMPRMDGYRLCREVRKRHEFKDLPFLMYTSTYVSPSDEKLSLDLGADVFMRKPAPASEIIKALHDATSEQRKMRTSSSPQMPDSDVMKEYNERLVGKLEQKNLDLARALEQLNTERARLRHLLEHSPAVIYTLKIEGTSVAPVVVSENIERLLGVTVARSARYEWWLDSLHPGDRDRVLAVLAKSLTEGGYSTEYRIRHEDGSYHWVEDNNRVICDAAGQPQEAVGVWTDVTERKKAAETLDALRRQQELILNSAGEGIHGLDFEGKIVFTNPKGAELLGWNAGELLGRPSHPTIHHSKKDGSDYPVEACPIYASMRDGATRRATNDVFWRKDGTCFPVDYVAAPIKEENGEIAGSIITFKDITDQVAAEARLQLQAEQYRLLFETNPNPMWVFETKTLRILAVNAAAIQQYGYSRDEFLQLSLKDLRPAEEVAELEQALSPADFPAHFSGRFRHLKKDRSLISVEIYSGPLIWQGVAARITTAIDVTQRERADVRLRQQANMLNEARDAIVVRNLVDQRVTFWNTGAERLYGWTSEEAIGRPIGELMVVEAEEVEAYTNIIRSTGQFQGEVKQRTKDGREIFVDGRASLISDADGVAHSVLLINSDITDQKKLETQLLRAQRLESIGTLAGGVAHDLNNVLTPILMCAETLRDDGLPAQDRQSVLTLIDESARRGANIVKQVLTFARGVEGERVVISPKHLLEEMMDIARTTFPKTIELTARYAEDLWPIKADPTQLHQVLLNVCVNARDAMPVGGALTLAAENVDLDESYAATLPGAKMGPHVLFRITDTGTGMPRATIEKIFDPFFTTKELGKGTGLGLSTALGIVKSHGGFLSVYSEPSRGTTFRIYLPAADAGAVTRSTAAAKMMKGHNELILLVDDEEMVRRVTKMTLEKNHYRVIEAKDGPEALALFAQQMDTTQLILTDMMLPHMDGVTLVRTIKKMKPNVPIIVSTGQGEQTSASELQSLGVKNMLPKPYDTERLLGAVHGALAATR